MAKPDSDVRSRFAQRLRAIRIPRGYRTARSFAQALGIDENRYTRYERAEVEPDLQLLLRICSLLDATPNDLLCDTIGTQPLAMELPPGFADRGMNGYHAPAPSQSTWSAPSPDMLNEARKAAGWELASVIALVEATADGLNPENLPELEKLRRIAPIHAKLETDAFDFIRQLPDRLGNIDVPDITQTEIGRLTREIIATMKPGSNDN